MGAGETQQHTVAVAALLLEAAWQEVHTHSAESRAPAGWVVAIRPGCFCQDTFPPR